MNRKFFSTSVLSLSIIASMQSHASLGQQLDSVMLDQQHLHANVSRTLSKDNLFTDYQLSLPNNLIVHELVNTNGEVYKITWQGKGKRPNMEQILGEYFSDFYNDKPRHHATSRHFDKVNDKIIIHSRVRNRFFYGEATIPQLVPAIPANNS